MDKNLSSTQNIINAFSILELLGLSELSQTEKERILLEINEQIWNGFVVEKLETLLSDRQIVAVNKMIDERKDNNEILAFVLNDAPHIKEEVFKYAGKVKIDIIKNHFTEILEKIEHAIHLSKNEEVILSLEKKKARCEKALTLVYKRQYNVPINSDRRVRLNLVRIYGSKNTKNSSTGI